MKRTISHYERGLIELALLQADAAYLILRQTKTLIDELLLIDEEADGKAEAETFETIFGDGDKRTIIDLLINLDVTVEDPLVCDGGGES